MCYVVRAIVQIVYRVQPLKFYYIVLSVTMNEKDIELTKLNGVGIDKNSEVPSPKWRQIFAASGTILLTATAGCTSGYSAVLLPQLQLPDSTFAVDITMMSWIAAISCLPLFVGNMISGFVMDRFGRRRSQLVLAVPYVVGWTIISLSRTIHFILLGRFITGLCQGLLGPLGPVFVGEISTPKYRGLLLSSLSLAIAVGVLASHIYGTFLHWKFASILCGIFPAVAYLILLYVPESPSWLASKGRIDECRASFIWYRGCSEDAVLELSKLIKSSEKPAEKGSFFRRFISNIRKPEFRRPLHVMTIFFITTQLTGTNVFCAYTASIVKPLIGENISEYTAMLMLDGFRCFALAAACVLIRRVNRRPVAMFSGCLTSLSLIALATYIYLIEMKTAVPSAIVSVGLTFCYIVFSSLGIVVLPWTMVGEVFPAATRGLGSGISVMMTSLFFFAVVKTAPGLFHDIGQYGTFLLYGCCTLAGTAYLFFYLPETKGKTLLQVEENFIRAHRR